ncbi:MAG: metal-sensing transcriptional repressor [candidate division WWE3 bacterium]|nr:metal-sensing transcriptional repressor [candidate division WWE3 bacterium]
MIKSNTDPILTSLKKAHTSLGKIIRMRENGEYCIDIMQQNLAVIGLLRSAHQSLMEGHLNSCFKNAMATSNSQKKKKMTAEILQVTKLFNR